MIVLATAVFAGAASMRTLDALLPAMASDYGQSVGTVGTAITAYAISYGGFQLIYGPLGDSFGPYRVITAGAMLSAFATLACAFAPTIEWLVALRFVAGCVAASIGPMTLVWISHATSEDERPIIVARMTAASILGASAGQVGGGVIGGLLGWQAIFVTIALLFGASGLMLARAGAQHPGLRLAARRKPGAGERPWSTLLKLLRRSAVQATLLIVAVESFAIYMSMTYVAAMLQTRLSVSAGRAGLLAALFSMGGIFFVLLAGPIMARVREQDRATLGGSLAAFGCALLILFPSAFATGGALLIAGLGFFMLHNSLQVRATQMAPEAPGTGLSLFAATFFLGQALGAVAGGWSFDRLGPSFSFGISAAILAALALIVAKSGSAQARS